MIAREYVTMKGTRGGVLVSMSEECSFLEGLDQLRSAVLRNREFFAASPVSLELGWREVTDDEYDRLSETLTGLGVRLLGIISTSLATRRLFESHGVKAVIGTLGLAKHGGRARLRGGVPTPVLPAPAEPAPEAVAEASPEEAVTEAPGLQEASCAPVGEGEEPAKPAEAPPGPQGLVVDEALAPAVADPTLLVRKTVRSGQCIDFPGNIVVLGDVNAGAEIRAGGDVVVLGHLRGMAHAGVGGKETATVLALNLHASRVRIGDLVGHVDMRKSFQNNAAVLTRIDDKGGLTSILYGN